MTATSEKAPIWPDYQIQVDVDGAAAWDGMVWLVTHHPDNPEERVAVGVSTIARLCDVPGLIEDAFYASGLGR